MFSLPFIEIFTDRKSFKQILAQKPINFPPSKVIFLGKMSAGKKITEIKVMPAKKNIENKKFLIICFEN